MIKPYDFVPFLESRKYKARGSIEGKISIKVKAITPVHISSGSYGIKDNKNIYKEFVKVNNEPIIPGTSFKGCIRNIAESISYSCLSTGRSIKKYKIPNKKRENCGGCIICNMFGAPGFKSRIQFPDLKPVEYKTDIIGIPKSYSPRPNTKGYLDNSGMYKGYKFYKHGINGIQPTGNVPCEFVLAGSEFEGDIIFQNLSREQVQLLCFSMGLSEDINPKIGYGKSYFYGSIEVTSDPKWAKLAKEYKEIKSTSIRRNIDALSKILDYNNALKTLGEG